MPIRVVPEASVKAVTDAVVKPLVATLMTELSDRFWGVVKRDVTVHCERCWKAHGLRVPMGWAGRDADGSWRLAASVRRRGKYPGAPHTYYMATVGASRESVTIRCPGCGRQRTLKALGVANRAAGRRDLFV